MSDRSYYDRNYPDYEKQNSSEKLEFYLSLLNRRLRPGERIFELGVGQGSFSQVAGRQYQVSGSDVNEFGVEQTRRKLPSGDFQVGSVERVPDSIPAVVSWDVLEHLPALPEKLRSFHSKIAPGGFLFAAVPVYDGPLGWMVRWLDKDPTHLTQESRQFWLNALRESGFEVVEWGGILRKFVGRRYLHFTSPQWLLKRVGSAIYLVAQR